jgi:EAL domain-containing protein (putative c-di-GMP-specific phosphodiesterase class I)
MFRVLVVDDDPDCLNLFAAGLRAGGMTVETAKNGAEALALVGTGDLDVIVSDLSMPVLSGLAFVRAVRESDLDLPVVLVTGRPDLETAIQAVEYGAFRYLVKPVPAQILRETVQNGALWHQLARVKREALQLDGSAGRQLGDRAALEPRFYSALSSIWMAYQPIVAPSRGGTAAYEALLRTHEPSLLRPADFLDAAERLGQVHALGRAVRATVAASIQEVPPDVDLFVNLHPLDLQDPDLYRTDAPLSVYASRVVLEITERAPLDDQPDLAQRVALLRELGYRIALDDLGAGYAGLSALTRLDPDIVKLDSSLVHDLDKKPLNQKVVVTMIELCNQLGMAVVAEGVESAGEARVLERMGCDLLQGYHFGQPSRHFGAGGGGAPAVRGIPAGGSARPPCLRPAAPR